MFDVNILNGLDRLSIYLARPSGEILGCIDDEIDETSASLTIGLNQMYELTFTIIKNENLVQSWYDYLHEGMYLFVDKVGIFKMNQPTVSFDGVKNSKSIVAYSCDKELDDKTISLSFNEGIETSQEYLVTYDEDEEEPLLNPYTGIPYDWILLYNTIPEQLEIFKRNFNDYMYGVPNADGEIIVTYTSQISELEDLFSLIPRLKSKIVPSYDDNLNLGYEAEEYVTYEYSDDGESVTSIIIDATPFGKRIDELITFYTKYSDQLSLLSLVLEKTDGNWTVGDIYGVKDQDFTLANKKYQFDADENIYSFLTNTLAQASNCIINFDIINRKVNVTPVDKIGENTGIVMSYDNLMNTMGITCDEDNLCTRLVVTGGNDLGIEQVNFGLDYIDDIDYKINVHDENGKRIYVSDELAEKYAEYVKYRESLRADYIQYSKDYNSYIDEIYDLQYRVPNDSLKTDWSTYSLTELDAALTSYKNLLAALITLYKEDYGVAGENADGSINESYMRNTIYWYDYCAYQATITEIECAIATYPYYSDEEKWTSDNLSKYQEEIHAWETEWSLYGIIELQSKIATYTQNMSLLAESSVILVSQYGEEIKTWDELTADEKAMFGDLEANYYYDTYMKYYNNKQSAQAYLDELQEQVTELENAQASAQEQRTEIVQNVTMSNYFEADECKILNRLFKESTYTNDNILTTSLNNLVDSLDVAYELLEDGQEQASILSRPQLHFNITSDNLLALPEFQSLWNMFVPGNYMMVQYRDDTYVKLRMVSYGFNPCIPSNKDLTITFSNYIRSKSGLSDIESMLGLATSSGGGSGSSGSSSGGVYGESDDIDVTISNTMLSRLLNSESFGTKVTNVILDTLDANSITAKFATFSELSVGSVSINGKCLKTGYICDTSYNGTDGNTDNTEGTVINLESGQFSFGGGKLTYNGSELMVSGVLSSTMDYTDVSLSTVLRKGTINFYCDYYNANYPVDDEGRSGYISGDFYSTAVSKMGLAIFGYGIIDFCTADIAVADYDTHQSHLGRSGSIYVQTYNSDGSVDKLQQITFTKGFMTTSFS